MQDTTKAAKMKSNVWSPIALVLFMLNSVQLAFCGDVSEAKIIPQLVLGMPGSDGVRSMDALLLLEKGGIVLDPFFRAPGLELSAVIIKRGDDRRMIRLLDFPEPMGTSPTAAQEFEVGSLDAPTRAIVGARYWLGVSDPENIRAGDAAQDSYYASLARYKAPKKEGLEPHADNVVAVSEPVLIGEFWSPRFHIYPLCYVDTAQRLMATAGVPVIPEMKIHSNAYGTTFDIRFVNLSNESVELFSPFLEHTGGGNSPVQLWVNGVRDGQEFRSDILHSEFGRNAVKWMSSKIPAGAIVGKSRTTRLDPGEYNAHFIVKDLFLTGDLPFGDKDGVFIDFNPSTAKTILKTPEVKFIVR